MHCAMKKGSVGTSCWTLLCHSEAPLSFSQKCIPFFYCLYATGCKLGMANEKAVTPMDGSGFADGVKV